MKELLLIDVSLIAAFVCAFLSAGYYARQSHKLKTKLKESETSKDALVAALKTFENKHLLNPSEDCAQLLADLVSSGALLRIEIIDGKDLFLRRR